MTRPLEDLAAIFKALSDPNRLAILQLVRERCRRGCSVSSENENNNVSAIAERFDLSLSTVSHHLRELRNAGLIRCEKKGQRVICTPDEEVLQSLREFVESQDSRGKPRGRRRS